MHLNSHSDTLADQEAKYRPMQITDIIEENYDDPVQLTGIPRGLHAEIRPRIGLPGPLSLNEKFAEYDFMIRQGDLSSPSLYALVNFSLNTEQADDTEKLGYLNPWTILSYLRTAEQDGLEVTVFGKPVPDPWLPQVYADSISVLGITIGKSDTKQ